MKLRILFLATLAAAASPAGADVTAVYKSNVPFPGPEVKIEVAQDGTSRVETEQLSVITREGQVYVLLQMAGTLILTDLEDLKSAMRKTMVEDGHGPCPRAASYRMPQGLVRRGTATVRGRVGDAWFRRLDKSVLDPRPVAVMSHDPQLAPLSTPAAAFYRASAIFLTDCAKRPLADSARELEGIMKTGAPLSFETMELDTLDRAPVDSSRFALPGKPKTIEELLAIHRRNRPSKPRAGGGN